MVLERASPRRIAIQEEDGHAPCSLPTRGARPAARDFHRPFGAPTRRAPGVSAIRRSIARFANACVKLLPPAPPPAGGPAPSDAPRAHASVSSPWRIYRIYARPGHLLLRDEHGRILDLGVMKGAEPNLTYRLFARGLQGRGFATRTQLLDDIARRIESGETGNELLTLPAWEQARGADLDRGTHTDVSMKLRR